MAKKSNESPLTPSGKTDINKPVHAPSMPEEFRPKQKIYTPEELTKFADLILEAEERKRNIKPKVTKKKNKASSPTFEGIGTLTDADLGALTSSPLDSKYNTSAFNEYTDLPHPESLFGQLRTRPGLDFTPAAVSLKKKRDIQRWRKQAKLHGQPLLDSGKEMGPEVLHGSRYDPANYTYGPVRNYLDIETVGTNLYKGSVLSYAVIKKAFNLDTGEWDIVSKRTRYYYPTDEDKLLTDPATGEPVYDTSIGISGLSDENIARRRKMQLAELGKRKEYAKHWSANEFRGLLRYLGNDPVVGHNVTQFDWPKLILSLDPGKHLTEKDLPVGGLIDTLHLAEGTRGRGPGRNTLSVLYRLCTGHTPEQDGYTAHDALEDIQLTAIVHEHMLKSKSRMGKVSRYLLHHPGLSTQFRDEMIKGMTEVFGMTPEMQDIVDNIVGDEGTIEDHIADVSFDGSSEVSRDLQLQSLGVPMGDNLELKELQDAISRLTSAIEGQTKQGLASSSIIKQAAGLDTIEARKQFLHDVLGITGDVDTDDWNSDHTAAGYALKRANALYKAKHEGQLETFPETGPRVRFGEGVNESWFVPIPNIVEDPIVQEWKKQHYLEAEHADSAKARHAELTRQAQAELAAERTKESRLGFNWGRADELVRVDHGDGWIGTYRHGYEQPWEPTKISDKPGEGLSSVGKENMNYFKLFNDELKKSSEAVKHFGENIRRSTPYYHFEQWRASANQQADSVYGAASYFVPKPFKEASSRLYSSIKQHANSVWDRQAATIGAVGRGIKLGSTIIGGIVGSAAGPVGMAAGTAAGRGAGELLAQGTQLIGNYGNRKIRQWGEEAASRINLWAGVAELYIAPARIVASAFKALARTSWRLGGSFLRVIDSFNKLGLPLTNLTGVSYGQLQRSYIGDRMIGANSGTINNAYNSMANAQMELYGMGQLNQDRVIAAAMTGTFGTVYGYGGDTQEQYAQTVNTIYNQMRGASPQSKQRLMMLAGKIDSTLPATLQQMENLGISDYRSIQNGSWLASRNVRLYTAADNERGISSDAQRARYSRANMEWGGLLTSFTETRNQFAVRIWESFGKNIMSGLNDAFHKIAMGDWRGALKDVKKTASAFWNSLTKEIFGESKSLRDVGNIFGEKLKNIIMKLLPIATTAMNAYIDIVTLGLQKIAPIIMDFIDEVGTRLSFTKIEFDWGFKDGKPWVRPVVKTLQNTVSPDDIKISDINKSMLPGFSSWYDAKWQTTEGQQDVKNKSVREVMELFDREKGILSEGWMSPEGVYINSVDKMMKYTAGKQSFKDYYGSYDPRKDYNVAGLRKLMGEEHVRSLFKPEDYDAIKHAIEILAREGKAGLSAGMSQLVESLIQIKFDLYEGTSENPGRKVGSGSYTTGSGGKTAVMGDLSNLVRVTEHTIKEAM